MERTASRQGEARPLAMTVSDRWRDAVGPAHTVPHPSG